ncbi:hypothetical protein [Actinomadura litoris]|uniref:hypothetical protein n=1 Tax=Actinomadura litoris TaxID=2678616 RepID=UPI001FA6B796|nr:hypothetical protein [Actinomadura litoris]
MTVPVAAAARPHTDAVAAALTAAEVLVGRGIQPDGSGWQGDPGRSEHRRYVVLYPGAGLVDGSVAVPTEYLVYSCQFTCVAASQPMAEGLADIVKSLFVGQLLAVEGRASYRGQLLLDRPAARDDQVAPPVHYSVTQIGWRTQAA